ncbi:MAG TPA: TonB-dependent receptor [Methylotenera sp.]|nr:TonB-dependent receptor [Methylotenera sp.]HPH05568.1 TonB-dependent receptor [Methylotenera sp.]HPN00018.1 TonB-dependent receptor [Methylotenera sp.]
MWLKQYLELLPIWLIMFSANAAQAEEAIELETIKITGQQDDVSARSDAATQKVIVDRKEIESLGVQTVGEVLGKLPGVEVKGGGHRARGMSRDSVQILIDGERQVGGAGGALFRLPAEQLERVEILRGASAEYGGASVLTVNLVLKKALSKRSTDFKLGLGVRDDEPNAQFSWTENGGSNNFSWSLPISFNLHHSPVDSNMERRYSTSGVNTFWQNEQTSGTSKMGHYAFSPRFTWRSERDSLTVSPMYFYGPSNNKSRTNITEYTNPAAGLGLTDIGERDSRESSTHRMWRLRIEGEKHVNNAKLSGRLAFNDGRNQSDVTRDVYDAANVLTSFKESTRTTNKEFNTAARVDKTFGNHLLSTGAEFVKNRREDSQLFGGGFAATGSHRASSRDGILWVQDDWTPIDTFTLTTGLRLENMTIAAEDVSQQRVGLLPSIAARWQPNDQWVLRSSLGAGMKMPKLDEISNATTRSVAENNPAEADKRGNANLRPERNVNFEAALEHYLPQKAGVLGVNVYARATSDFIERRVQQEGVRWVDRPYNEGDALHYGLELDAKVRMDNFGWQGATLKSHLTLPYGRVDDERLGIKRMARDTPRYVLSMGLDQSLPKLNASYGISAQISGRSETDIPNEQSSFSESITTLDAYWLYKLSPTYNLRLSGRNLLAADIHKQNTFTQGLNDWQLVSDDDGKRSLMVTLEGRW